MNTNEQGRRVLVTLSGAARNDLGEADEPIKLLTTGEVTTIEGGYLLRYEESQTDESDGSVMTQEILLLIEPNQVTMTRLGDFGTSMVFVKDRRFEGVYRTPYGDMGMALFATRVDVDAAPDHGSIYLEYQLDFQGGYASMHTMQVDYVASDLPC